MLMARRMLQIAMKESGGWDSPLAEWLRNEFKKWAASIPQLASLRIKRWWNIPLTEGSPHEELHLFSDASAIGYAAVAYRRVTGEDGSTHVTILTARSHVVPINAARASHHGSIPRLELTAADKATELRQLIETSMMRVFPRTVMWTDSQCVLKQIFDTTKNFKAFFSNRLSKIHAATDNKEWRYVDSKNNPADHASRGIQAHKMEKWDVFHNGPRFLKKIGITVLPPSKNSFPSRP